MPAKKIMIVRHAEKPTDALQGVDESGTPGPEFLIVKGWQRAGALVRFFAPVNDDSRLPAFLFAAAPEKKKDTPDGSGSKSLRPLQTITPLSKFLGIEINLDFTKGQEAGVAAAAMACDGVTLIAWQHEDIPAIAGAILGAPGIVPSPWDGTRFDILWVFDLQADGTYAFSQVPQMLLAGDLAATLVSPPTNP